MYRVWREDDQDEPMGRFKTWEQAKKYIEELKDFDARNNNPFEERYYITKELESGKTNNGFKIKRNR